MCGGVLLPQVIFIDKSFIIDIIYHKIEITIIIKVSKGPSV